MKFIIRNNQVETDDGKRVQPLYVYKFSDMFKELSQLPEGTEINMYNVWDTYYDRRDNVLVLKSNTLTYDITSTPEQVNIDSSKEVDNNDLSGNNISDNDSGVPDSSVHSAVQEQPDSADEIPGDDQREHQDAGEVNNNNSNEIGEG